MSTPFLLGFATRVLQRLLVDKQIEIARSESIDSCHSAINASVSIMNPHRMSARKPPFPILLPKERDRSQKDRTRRA